MSKRRSKSYLVPPLSKGKLKGGSKGSPARCLLSEMHFRVGLPFENINHIVNLFFK